MRPLTAVASAFLLVTAACQNTIIDPGLPPYQENGSTRLDVLGLAPGNMFEATQNWSDHTRFRFWHIDQGSLVAPYDIALAVEQIDQPVPFLDPYNVVRYRYVPQNSGSANPDGLPLGFTKSQEQPDGETYLGFTCSACHSTVVTYAGKGLLIDGAPSQVDFQGFYNDFTEAVRMNLENPAKFARLGAKLTDGTPEALDRLRLRMSAAASRLEERRELNRTATVYGYGRVDAIGQIFNAVASANIGIPENRVDPNAPVNFPFLWGTHQSNVVQWNGFAPNVTKFNDIRILGPIVRNAGEVLGVFGRIDIPAGRPGDPSVAYDNSTRIKNLMRIENWLEELNPPVWPEQVFGPVDAEKAARGAVVYADESLGNCLSCHQVLTSPRQCYNATMTPLETVGTDPGQALNSLATAKTGPLEGRWVRLPRQGGKLGPEEPILNILVHQVMWGGIKDIEEHPVTGLASLVRAFSAERREDKCETPFVPNTNFKAYKARPLHGIWATAPYLHNGSVPTLRALLEPEDARPETFTLGGWEFDPVAVGYAPYQGPRAFTFDTSLAGNSNRGHVWGTALSDADKDALVAYLKTL